MISPTFHYPRTASVDDILIHADAFFEDTIRTHQTSMLLQRMDPDQIDGYIREARGKWVQGRARVRASILELVAAREVDRPKGLDLQ